MAGAGEPRGPEASRLRAGRSLGDGARAWIVGLDRGMTIGVRRRDRPPFLSWIAFAIGAAGVVAGMPDVNLAVLAIAVAVIGLGIVYWEVARRRP